MFFDESAIEFVAPASENQPSRPWRRQIKGDGGSCRSPTEAERNHHLWHCPRGRAGRRVVLLRKPPLHASKLFWPGLRAAIADRLAQRPRSRRWRRRWREARAESPAGGPGKGRGRSDDAGSSPGGIGCDQRDATARQPSRRAGPNARRVRADRIGFDRSRGGFTVVRKRHRWRRRNWSGTGSGARLWERTRAR